MKVETRIKLDKCNKESNIFSFIKSKVSIADILGEYTSFVKDGEYLIASCPFHEDEKNSFRAHAKKNIFYCFECHKGGDIVSLVAMMEGCEQYEAAEKIKAKLG